MRKSNVSAALPGLSLLLAAAGCRKKTAAAPPPPPPAEAPPPAKPSVSEFVAAPSVIERGQPATLRWKVENATDMSITEGVGEVKPEGSRRVFPTPAH